MSTTTQKKAQKETAAQKKARIAALVQKADETYLPLISDEAEKMQGAEQAVGLSRVVIGRMTLRYSEVQLENGVAAATIQAAIIGALNKPTGGDYLWATIETWQKAATIEDSLSEESRGKLSEDSLRKLSWFPEEATDDKPSRQSFFDKLVTDGTTSNRAVRTAVAAVKPEKAPKAEPSNADKAKAITDALSKSGEALRRSFEQSRSGVAWSAELQKAVTAAVLLGVMIGRGKPHDKPSDAEKLAAGQLAYFGPVEDDGLDDA